MTQWYGRLGLNDDFDDPIKDVFIDGMTTMGDWAIMTPASWKIYGIGKLGLGYGQKYAKRKDGAWIKIEG